MKYYLCPLCRLFDRCHGVGCTFKSVFEAGLSAGAVAKIYLTAMGLGIASGALIVFFVQDAMLLFGATVLLLTVAITQFFNLSDSMHHLVLNSFQQSDSISNMAREFKKLSQELHDARIASDIAAFEAEYRKGDKKCND